MKRIFYALFMGALFFLAGIFFKILVVQMAQNGNALALTLSRLPLELAAAAFGFFSFLWCLSKNGFYHFLLTLSVCALTLAFTFSRKTTLMELLSDQFHNYTFEVLQSEQQSDSIYPNSSLIAQNPVPIYYVEDEDPKTAVDGQLVNDLIRFVQTLPEELYEHAAALYLVEDEAFVSSAEGLDELEVFGFSSNGSMSSTIRLVTEVPYDQLAQLKDGQIVYLDNVEFYEETIVHELAHLMDMRANQNNTIYSDSEEFISLYENGKDSLTEYGASDIGEFFAEAATFYYMYPELLVDKNIDVFNYFNGLFNRY